MIGHNFYPLYQESHFYYSQDLKYNSIHLVHTKKNVNFFLLILNLFFKDPIKKKNNK